jgi:AmmeMemoRadiSam system protein B
MSVSPDISSLEQPRHTRASIVAGIFYPASAEELSENIGSLMDIPELPSGQCQAILSPHGSLQYSGSVAARAWKAATGFPASTIVILSPSHRCFEPGIFLPEARAFSVPTGVFKVDHHLVKQLAHSSTSVSLSDIPHFEDHSIEMQLIFAARCFPEAAILPIIIAGADDQELDSLFTNLQFVLGDRLGSTLFVLTTNLAVDEDAAACRARSAAFVDMVEKADARAVGALCKTPPSFCGGRIIAAFLRSTLSYGMKAKSLGFVDSAPIAERGEPIVGYAAIGFSR